MDTRPFSAVLKRLPLTPMQQTELSDAFMAANSPEEFTGFLDAYQLHPEVKRSLADAAQFTRPSFAGAEGISEVPWFDREAPGTRISARDVLNMLPAIGGTVGGLAAAPLGPLAGSGLAMLAGAGGEALRQMGSRAIGVEAPETPEAAAEAIAGEGMLNAASEVGGRVMAKYIKPRDLFPIPKSEMVAHHGSPHKIGPDMPAPKDRFRLEGVGGGTGGQVQGYGLYFAERPETAKYYQGVTAQGIVGANDELELRHRVIEATRSGDQDTANVLNNLLDWKSPSRVRQHIERNPKAYDSPEKALKLVDEFAPRFRERSHFYTVDIPDTAVERMLDWDKPLSEQPEAVAALRQLAADHPLLADALQPMELKATTGATVYSLLTQEMAKGPGGDIWKAMRLTNGTAEKNASAKLRELGIPGIKYLDQGSRGAGTGTRNFVLFDDSLVKILERDGEKLSAAEVLDAVGKNKGMSIPPAKLERGLKGDEGFVYHATNAERLEEIAESGRLKTHRPFEFTDQEAWPDGSVERRSYFGASPEHLYQFAPESGTPVVVRTKRTPFMRRESTGDVYSTKPIRGKDLEYLGTDNQWHPVSDLAAKKTDKLSASAVLDAVKKGKK